jgi:lysophospholipase L1-like esterase
VKTSRPRWTRWVVALAATCAALLLAEGGVRLLRVSGLLRGVGPVVMAVHDPLGWHYPPDTLVRHRGRGFDVVCRFDHDGHRAMPRGGPGLARAVFVGDSLTFGWGVSATRAFPALVARDLGLAASNLGVAGYGADQSYLHLLEHGLRERPRVVVFTHCANDLDEVARGRAYGRTKPYFALEASGALQLFPPEGRRTWLETGSELWRAGRSRLGRVRTPGASTDSRRSRALVAALVRAMAEKSARAGATFLLVHSDAGWVGSDLPSSARSVDVHPALAAQRAPLLFPHDPHWNELGHRVVAAEIRRTMLRPGGAVRDRR